MSLCTPWLDGAEVAECCNLTDCDNPSIFDGAAEIASELLFQFSLRRYPGLCETTARPCRTGCGCPWQVLSRGHIIWNPMNILPLYGWWCDDTACGCTPLSRVLLAGYVQEIIEVLIDGEVVDPDTYRVDQHRWLVRTRPSADDQVNVWPGCQAMDLPDTEEGTWSVTYTYGKTIPADGVNAARELACEIAKACNGEDCALPANTVQVARQGITVQIPSYVSWGFEKGGRSIPRGWKTGMPAVDAFLNARNPTGVPRIPNFWSPTARLRYAPTLGVQIVSS